MNRNPTPAEAPPRESDRQPPAANRQPTFDRPQRRPGKRKTPRRVDPNRSLKRGIWAYFLLLIFEGALRKWFLPGLATPLLVIRDPIALGLLVMAFGRGLLPLNAYVIGMAVIGAVGSLTAVALGHGNIPIAVYGARTLLIHFPLIFVIGRVFNGADVLKIGKATLWISIPMAVLLGLQFYSPQTAWVNRGVGGDIEGAGFDGAMGFFRPPGTFSFTNGTTLFYSFAAPFIIYFWLCGKGVSKLVLVAATFGLLASIPLSISRGLLFQVCLTGIFAIAVISRRPKFLPKLLMAAVALVAGFAVLSATPFFATATEAFGARFESANRVEGGMEGVLVDRFLGGLWGAVFGSVNQPFFGHGIGMGTNVGSMFLEGGKFFLIAEGEWGRVVGELGPLLGLVLIIFRVGLAWDLAVRAYQRLVDGDLLPWLLLSVGLITVAQGGWAQPTALGFFVMIAGLLLASVKVPKKKRPRGARRSPARQRLAIRSGRA